MIVSIKLKDFHVHKSYRGIFIDASGIVTVDEPNTTARLKINKSPNHAINLEITDASLFFKGMSNEQRRECAIDIKRQIRMQINDVLKKEMERLFV